MDPDETKGAGLGAVLKRRITRATDGDNRPDRSEILEALAVAGDVTVDTVRRHLSGSTLCPPRERLAAFAGVLGCSEAELVAAAEADGCSYSSDGKAARPSGLYDVIPTARMEIKADVANRRIEGYANTFRSEDSLDNHGDAVLPGAFTKTIRDRFPRKLIKVLYQHRDLIGQPEHLEEDSRGLFTVSRLSDTDEARARLRQVESGELAHMSIGFDAVREEFIRNDDGFVVGRLIRETKLYEYSLVMWPADEDAVVTSVKSLHDEAAPLIAQLEDLGAIPRGRSLSAGEREVLGQVERKLSTLAGRFKNLLGEAAPEATTRLGAAPVASTRDGGDRVTKLLAELGTIEAGLAEARSKVRISKL